MPFHNVGSIKYFTFDILQGEAIDHAIFTRQGGVSPAPWESLNVGGTVGDLSERVLENRQRLFNALHRKLETSFDIWQTHSANVIYADNPREPSSDFPRGDIVLTDLPTVTLFMRFADCVPILLYDPACRVVGIVHAGWLGTVRRAASTAVEAMVDRYGTKPENLLAGVGPSIGPDHYEVKGDVIQRVRQSFGAAADRFLPTVDGAIHFDLWAANMWQLSQVGVRRTELARLCTGCNLSDWYSHRAEAGRTGRFGALIGLC
jgi:YfiH family protein